MMYTNDFFAVGNSAPNDNLVQLIDSFTGESVTFQKVSTWIDETFLIPNDSRVLEDEIIYRSRGNDYYVNTVVFSTKRVYVTSFGARSSYTADQRPAIQKAFDISSKLGLKLIFPSGHYLIDSHTDDLALRGAHANILELRSYLDVEFEEYSVIKLSEYFDDKAFVLFSGLNAADPEFFKPIYNMSFKGRGVIDFNGGISQLRTSYKRRIGFEGGNCTNVDIDGLYWTNGDLTNCIGAGWAGNGSKVSIHNCIFENLVVSNEKMNYDHSTIYGNVDFLSVHDNVFMGNQSTRLVGCACEIHGSNSSFSNNKVYNYTRMNFVAGIQKEKGNITNISISDNIAEIVNAGVYLWPDKGCTISNVFITSNNLKHIHVTGREMLYNGGQCLFIIQGKGGDCQRITVKNNVSHILYTEGDYSRYAAGILARTESLEISDNHFIGHSLGILFDKDRDELNSELNEYSFITIVNNNFTSSSKLVTVAAKKLNYCLIANNSTVLGSNALTNLIDISSAIIQSTTIRGNIYISNQPKVEFTPSSVFLADPSNKAQYVLSSVKTPLPVVNGGASVLITPVLSSNHKRVGAMYTIQPMYPVPELFFNAHTFGAGVISDVKFKVDNTTIFVIQGNANFVSNLIVDL
ncbi:hypothetical protein [Chryseobacterium sp. KMC2]|uniref:hypothetical protein n=1 Tax=Chryseobacterium sp. KMC2 TaxID=2800705 RepID=UPI00192436B3|nr:hypothetical protein [Chryseobacterium sp. KMC2]MBL3549679.1 hypothetical protein [Chryseobacterium sp. KMC2]